MVTDQQVRRLLKLTQTEKTQAIAAAKAGMDRKTARKYLRSGKLPSERASARTWRTRADPFDEVWEKVRQQLVLNPGLEAKTLFRWLQREHRGRFQDGQLRTLQRRVKTWRATEGPAKEVFFAQVHRPGELCQSDFTHMTKLRSPMAVMEHLVLLDPRRGVAAGHAQERQIARKLGRQEGGEARLAGAEQFARPADLQVLLGNLNAAGTICVCCHRSGTATTPTISRRARNGMPGLNVFCRTGDGIYHSYNDRSAIPHSVQTAASSIGCAHFGQRPRLSRRKRRRADGPQMRGHKRAA